jgi:hypothetical protein
MDLNRYQFTYNTGKAAHKAPAPRPFSAPAQNIVYLRRANGSMVPIHNSNGGFLPASSTVPNWTAGHQATQSKATQDNMQEAAKRMKAADESREVVCIMEYRYRPTDGLLMVQASVIWAWDPATRQQRPIVPKGINVTVPGYVYAYHHGNGDYRYYK